MAEKYWLKITPIDSDDFGDTQFKYYGELYKCKSLVWNDYYREEPTLKQVLNELEEADESGELEEELRENGVI